MKELIAAAIIAATLLACSNAQAEPYNGPSALMTFVKKANGSFVGYKNERMETWAECTARMNSIQTTRGDGVKARCLPLHLEEEVITAEHDNYLTY